MKKTLIAIIAISWLIVVALSVILLLATPHDLPISAGSIKAKKVMIDGQPFIRIDGDGMNYVSQFQLINVDRDDSGKRIVVRCFRIMKNPFSKAIVSDGWPVFCPLEGATLGKYSVVYRSSEGEQLAGTFDVQ